jgi:hypothetical protein
MLPSYVSTQKHFMTNLDCCHYIAIEFKKHGECAPPKAAATLVCASTGILMLHAVHKADLGHLTFGHQNL